jgi:Domain of unknown function (DUF4136)
MKRLTYLIVLAVLIPGCSSLKTNVEYDETRDFSLYETFAHLRMDDQMRGSIGGAAAVAKAIDRAVEDGIAARGYALADEKADLLVTYVLSVSQIQTTYEPLPYSARGSGASLPIEADREGTFTLDVIDATTNELVWRATASDAVTRNNPDAEKNIRALVTKLLSDFPARQ